MNTADERHTTTPPLIFLDTETTGLGLADDIWEFAAIRRDADGSEHDLHMFIEHDVRKCARLPERFRADHRGRFPAECSGAIRTKEEAAKLIHHFTRTRTGEPAPHIVGAVPNFDTERIALLLRAYALVPGWHHHLIDVENLAAAHLFTRGIPVSLPWDSDALSIAVGVQPPTDDRHTAMGDARWARALYDAIMTTTRPGEVSP